MNVSLRRPRRCCRRATATPCMDRASADAQRIAALPDSEFLAALQRHFGGRQGLFLRASPRRTFPLKLAYIGSEAADRVVRIGNAAQILHPVAGQGFNIGLRDAWELASLCGDTPAEIGNAAMLAAYARGGAPTCSWPRLHRFSGAHVLQRCRAAAARARARPAGAGSVSAVEDLRRAAHDVRGAR